MVPPCPPSLTIRKAPAGGLTEGGHEYGVTTGRRRRCGWFDGPIANFSARVNGLTHIALTKLDVLSAFDTISVCVAYDCDGVRYTSVPEHESVFAHAVPVYEELPGWKCGYLRVPYLRGAAETRARIRAAPRGARAHTHRVRLGWPYPRADHQPFLALATTRPRLGHATTLDTRWQGVMYEQVRYRVG